VAAGRDRGALAEIVGDRAGVVQARIASLGDPAELRAVAEGCSAVINCVGAIAAEPLIEAASGAGSAYLDAVSEQAVIRRILERHEQAPVPVVPAMGFDYALGDCIAKLASSGHEPLRELVIAYALSGSGVSRDAAGAAPVEAGGEVVFSDGRWVPAPGGVRRARFRFPAPIGSQPMQRYGSGEVITVPRHTDTARVTSLITASTWAPHPAMVGLMPYLRPIAAAVRRSPLAGALRQAAGGGGRDPEGDRETARFMIATLAYGEDGSVGRGLIEGRDFYGLTAATLALGAELIPQDGGGGARSPASALDPAGFLDALSGRWLDWRVE
jgi:short subunit dehydrogenase-like uncharacterized protein